MFLPELKFSLWADFIERDFLDRGFRELIDAGVINGATSNPAIFKGSILSSPAYKEQLGQLAGRSPKEKYEALAIYDIQKAADLLRPLYDRGDDGYVSIEVDPHLCDDTTGTLAEGRRLYRQINRPNVMIKVPATEAGYAAMEGLAADGISVNATLVFSKGQAVACARAFQKAFERSGEPADTVISVFVSRFDRALDEILAAKGVTPALTGIYNASAIYEAVEAMGVPKCRTLFASTGVKGDALRPSYYVDEMLAANTVNTAPIDTIKAFVAGGEKAARLPIASGRIAEHFAALKGAEVDFDAVSQQLVSDGLSAFKEAFDEILDALK
jgi:transaldolase